MNWYKKSEQTTAHVACVGGADNLNDKNMIDIMSGWLIRNDPSFSKRQFSFENIDLYEGRDFLKENKQYDVVLLLSIYAPNDRSLEKVRKTIFDRSDIHSREEWVKALLRTNADYIFAFGLWGEVSGSFLGEISGYQNSTQQSGWITVYSKGNLPEEEEKRPDWENVDVEWLDGFGDEKDELV